tara:strand:+ start:53 stop:826 length:774 start_codon:yes stop_codon:yes gene_type:complete
MAYKMDGPSLYKKKAGPVETNAETGNVNAYKKSNEVTLEEDDKLGFRKDQIKTDEMHSPDAYIKDKMKSPLEHMGYEVNIKKGKVVSEKEKPHGKLKTETEHEEYHDTYPSKPFTDAEGKPFKMKGSPMKRNFGIGADSPMKETTTQVLQGMNFQPYAYKGLSADDIPSFRDMVSLEQQQAARKAWKEKRTGKRKEREFEKLKEAGGETLEKLEIKEKERRKELAEEPSTTEVSGRQGEVKPENEINIRSNMNSYGI